MRITYHCWTESMILSLVDLQEGQLIPQYYYVSNNNKLVNKKDEERMIVWPYITVDFAYRTRSNFTIDCC